MLVITRGPHDLFHLIPLSLLQGAGSQPCGAGGAAGDGDGAAGAGAGGAQPHRASLEGCWPGPGEGSLEWLMCDLL